MVEDAGGWAGGVEGLWGGLVGDVSGVFVCLLIVSV